MGEEGFKDKLLGLPDKSADKLRGKKCHTDGAVRAHHQGEAQRIISILARDHGLPDSPGELKHLRKIAPRKLVCAALVKHRASASNQWIAERLAMGYPASMIQHANRIRKDTKAARNLEKHELALKSKD